MIHEWDFYALLFLVFSGVLLWVLCGAAVLAYLMHWVIL